MTTSSAGGSPSPSPSEKDRGKGKKSEDLGLVFYKDKRKLSRQSKEMLGKYVNLWSIKLSKEKLVCFLLGLSLHLYHELWMEAKEKVGIIFLIHSQSSFSKIYKRRIHGTTLLRN